MVVLVVLGADLRANDTATTILHWQQLQDLPDPLGVAGAYAGVSAGALIVAGGANFPEPLFKDGQRNPSARKAWCGEVYVLAEPEGQWQKSTPLPRPLAYGASVTTAEGVVCIGGCDAERSYSDVFALAWADGEVDQAALPALPSPCFNSTAVLLGTTIYVAGGQESVDSTRAMKSFLALDLAQDEPRWRELEPWPGPGRILAVAAAQDGSILLFSGCELLADATGCSAVVSCWRMRREISGAGISPMLTGSHRVAGRMTPVRGRELPMSRGP